MSHNSFKLKEIRRLKDPSPLIETVYKNFPHLTEPQLQHNKEELYRLVTDPNFIGLFVYDQTKVIAYLIGEIKQLNDGRVVYYISYMFVSPNYRNKKIASQLMNILVEKSDNWGIKFIMLTYDVTDKQLNYFYTKHKFVVDPILKNGSKNEVFVYTI